MMERYDVQNALQCVAEFELSLLCSQMLVKLSAFMNAPLDRFFGEYE